MPSSPTATSSLASSVSPRCPSRGLATYISVPLSPAPRRARRPRFIPSTPSGPSCPTAISCTRPCFPRTTRSSGSTPNAVRTCAGGVAGGMNRPGRARPPLIFTRSNHEIYDLYLYLWIGPACVPVKTIWPCGFKNVRSIIAILPTVSRGNTAPKIVRWELVSILSRAFSGRGQLREPPRTEKNMSRECEFFALFIYCKEERKKRDETTGRGREFL